MSISMCHWIWAAPGKGKAKGGHKCRTRLRAVSDQHSQLLGDGVLQSWVWEVASVSGPTASSIPPS